MQEWLLAQHGIVVYGTILALLLAGSIGLPVPEDLPLLLSGIVIHRGSVNLWIMFAVCYLGILVGDLFIFSVGRYFGKALYRKEWFRSRINPRKMRHIQLNLERRSLLMIFVARHLFYLRTVTFLTCGALKIRISRFVTADAVAALISAPLMMSLGYLAAEHYDAVVAFIHKAKWVSGVIGAVLIACAAAFWQYHRRRTAEEEAREEIEAPDLPDAAFRDEEIKPPTAS
jgi:membrane protein DedA with SNARE-associated domain